MIATKLFQGKMREKGYTIKLLSAAIGISGTSLFNKIHNVREFLASEIDSLSKLLSLSLAEKEEIFFAKCVELNSQTEA